VLSDVPLPLSVRSGGSLLVNHCGDASDLPPLKLAKAGQFVQPLVSVYQKTGANPVLSVEDESTINVSCLAANLINDKNFEVSKWKPLTPYLGFLTQTSEPVSIACGWVVRSASE
jgi:hypothetical protein